MKQRTFLHSLNEAVDGFIYVVRHERNMRVHFLMAFLVLLVALVLEVSRSDWMMLSVAVTAVLVAEMFNTAIEETIDYVKDGIHPIARVIKHVSAGAVLVAAINALIVGTFTFQKYWARPFHVFTHGIRYSPWHVTFAAMLVAIFLVIAWKAWLGRGTPFRGGPVSGHSAIAFSLWTVVLFVQENPFITAVAFLLAALVGQSRLRAKIHSFWEVVSGAALGMLVTALFFKIFCGY